MAGYFAIMAGYGNGEGGGGGGVFLGFEKKIPKYPVEMCKGIRDLFLVIYRNHLHHLHPLWDDFRMFRVQRACCLPCFRGYVGRSRPWQ